MQARAAPRLAALAVEFGDRPADAAMRAVQRLPERFGINVLHDDGPLLVVRVPGGLAGLRERARNIHAELTRSSGTSVWVGVGGLSSGERKALSASRDEARRAIRLARRAGGHPKAVLYEDVLLIAAIAADPHLGARMAAVLDPIAAYEASPAVLVDSLRAFYEADMATQAAASALGIHRHTLNYRLRRIQTILGLSPQRAPDRLLLETALLALRLGPSGGG